jgi:hypothetical protein
MKKKILLVTTMILLGCIRPTYWTRENKAKEKKSMMYGLMLMEKHHTITPELKKEMNRFCDCVIAKFEKAYPDGANRNNDTDQVIFKACRK